MISGKWLKQTELPVRPVVTPGPWWNLHKSGIFHGQAFQRPTIPRPRTTVVSVVKPVKRIKTRHLFIGSHPTKPGNEHSACKVVERSLLTIPQSLSRASPALSCRSLLGVRVPLVRVIVLDRERTPLRQCSYKQRVIPCLAAGLRP